MGLWFRVYIFKFREYFLDILFSFLVNFFLGV